MSFFGGFFSRTLRPCDLDRFHGPLTVPYGVVGGDAKNPGPGAAQEKICVSLERPHEYMVQVVLDYRMGLQPVSQLRRAMIPASQAGDMARRFP